MSDRTVVLDLAGAHKLARDLSAGGVFVQGYDIPLNEECEVVLRGGSDELRLAAKVVWSQGGGIGLQIHNCDSDMRMKIAALADAATAPAPETAPAEPTAAPADELLTLADEPSPDAGEVEAALASAPDEVSPTAEGAENDDDDKKGAANMHERLRGLTLAQQLKIAQHGDVSERTLLERMYQKNVWEALLRNPRLTGPEVARIARMGSLPRPHMELILNNGGWLQIPEVRRALLTNPRLGTDQALRILRLLPKHELKLAGMQTIYPLGVRDAAKRLLRELGGS